MTLIEKVNIILEKNKDARDNDNILFARFIFEFCSEFVKIANNEAYVSLSSFPHIPSFESVSRARRKIQEDNKILAKEDAMHSIKNIKNSYKLNFKK